MFTHALPQGSLRPADVLPPTLTPNAIFAMAPPAPRGMGFLGACLVYAACGAGLMWAPAIQTTIHQPTTATVVFNDPSSAPEIPAAARIAPPPPRAGIVAKDAPQRPQGWTPPLDTNIVPPTPTTLPERDASGDSLRAEEPEDARRVLSSDAVGATRPALPSVIDFDFRQMRVLTSVAPVYPPIARIARIQGEVVLLMAVDPHGIPTEVKALSGPHPSLEQEAMRVARLWRFEPATMNGQPVSAQFKLTLVFKLK